MAFVGLSSILIAAGVRERPVLYPNELIRVAGAAGAQREIDDWRGEVIFEETITDGRGLSGGIVLDSTFKQDTMLVTGLSSIVAASKGLRTAGLKVTGLRLDGRSFTTGFVATMGFFMVRHRVLA